MGSDADATPRRVFGRSTGMPMPTRRRASSCRFPMVLLWVLAAARQAGAAAATTEPSAGQRSIAITDCGAVADGTTVNTAKIQSAIDALAGSGGGTVVVPAGTFVSGAIFLKPGVNLELEAG